MNCDLIIIGAGAAGLYAANAAAEAGLHGVLMERRHRPGLKLLMTANHRCNMTHDDTVEEMLAAYGDPVAPFVAPAVTAFPPRSLRKWFERLDLKTTVIDRRVFPASEKADDVLHTLLDHLRDLEFPILYNCPVTGIRPIEGGYAVTAKKLELTAKYVLLATGGSSWPKTGSIGDGVRFAESLGLATEPLRTGLSGLELPQSSPLAEINSAALELQEIRLSADGLPSTTGNIIFDRGIIRGSAVYDLVRLGARSGIAINAVTIDFLPHYNAAKAGEMLTPSRLGALGLPPLLAQILTAGNSAAAAIVKAWPLQGVRTRPLKEAFVTMGGIARDEFNPETLEAKRLPGLFAAGETLDIDGPTGGYNLHLAYATACLAIRAIAAREGKSRPADRPRAPKPPLKQQQRSAFGANFWDDRKRRLQR